MKRLSGDQLDQNTFNISFKTEFGLDLCRCLGVGIKDDFQVDPVWFAAIRYTDEILCPVVFGLRYLATEVDEQLFNAFDGSVELLSGLAGVKDEGRAIFAQ